MSFSKIIFFSSLGLFLVIGGIALTKHLRESKTGDIALKTEILEEVLVQPEKKEPLATPTPNPKEISPLSADENITKTEVPQHDQNSELPDADLVSKFFATDASKLPFVETITYTSRVPWLKGRPAWLADYASHYETTRHFIARSLNKNLDYFTQKVLPGDRFNVLKKDLQFYLLIDMNHCRMWFYGIDKQSQERILLKSYPVGLGRKDEQKTSGYLTPLGKFSLGSKVAIYKPGTIGYFQDRKVEMIRVFGTRWIPLSEETNPATSSLKGYGIHGAPWEIDPQTGQLTENLSTIGKHESDGCIRLASKDMEELFAIVISKPTLVELVKDFHEATLPGIEKSRAKDSP